MLQKLEKDMVLMELELGEALKIGVVERSEKDVDV